MTQEKQPRKIKISPELDSVEIHFDVVTSNDSEESEDAPAKPHSYKVKSPNRPHKDFVDCMKKLRKHALELCEIAVDSKDINQWGISEVKVDGDYLLQQCRITMTLFKLVKSTGKIIQIKTPQCTLYPQSDDSVKYANADKLQAVFEDLVEEAYSYLSGKMDEQGQMPLFPGFQLMKVA
jgi:hypothetical protein